MAVVVFRRRQKPCHRPRRLKWKDQDLQMLHVPLPLGVGRIHQLQARSKSRQRLWMVMVFLQELFRHAGLPLYGRLMGMVEETDRVPVQ